VANTSNYREPGGSTWSIGGLLAILAGGVLRIVGALRIVAGDYYVTIAAPSLAANKTLTLPAEDGTVATLAGTETLTNKTLTLPTATFNCATVAAAGSDQGGATAITTASPCFILATGADGTKGIKLPAAAAGKWVVLKNNVNAVLKVYPATDDAINALSANAALSMAALTSALYVSYDGTTYYTTPLLPS